MVNEIFRKNKFSDYKSLSISTNIVVIPACNNTGTRVSSAIFEKLK